MLKFISICLFSSATAMSSENPNSPLPPRGTTQPKPIQRQCPSMTSHQHRRQTGQHFAADKSISLPVGSFMPRNPSEETRGVGADILLRIYGGNEQDDGESIDRLGHIGTDEDEEEDDTRDSSEGDGQSISDPEDEFGLFGRFDQKEEAAECQALSAFDAEGELSQVDPT